MEYWEFSFFVLVCVCVWVGGWVGVVWYGVFTCPQVCEHIHISVCMPFDQTQMHIYS